MKTAVILYADTLPLLHQAGEINELLAQVEPFLTDLEVWLFYQDLMPDTLPDFTRDVSQVVITKIHTPHLPESFLTLLEQIYRQRPVDLMLFASDGRGRELATRTAYRLNGSSCLYVETCHIRSDQFKVTKPAYENNLTAAFYLNHVPYCISPAAHACQPIGEIDMDPVKVKPLALNPLHNTWSTVEGLTPEKESQGLNDADRILAVGLGIKTKENMAVIKETADALQAELAASRPVVMNAWMEMSRLVGMSGRIVSPRVCIAAGVSGSGAFAAGIKNSELIVAINTDSHAPIFRIADIGIVDDLFDVLSELKKIIMAEKKRAYNGQTDQRSRFKKWEKRKQPLLSGRKNR